MLREAPRSHTAERPLSSVSSAWKTDRSVEVHTGKNETRSPSLTTYSPQNGSQMVAPTPTCLWGLRHLTRLCLCFQIVKWFV
jgi:hypothetical protein